MRLWLAFVLFYEITGGGYNQLCAQNTKKSVTSEATSEPKVTWPEAEGQGFPYQAGYR
jgi:hypothetical protein